MSHIADGPNDSRIAAVVEHLTLCTRLVELLDHNSTGVQAAALDAVGNILVGNTSQTQVMIDLGCLPKMVGFESFRSVPMTAAGPLTKLIPFRPNLHCASSANGHRLSVGALEFQE